MNLPDELNDDLLDILGRPNFACIHLANAMRADGIDIPRRSEAEQANVLFKLLSLYAAHGNAWREAAADWCDGMTARLQVAKGER